MSCQRIKTLSLAPVLLLFLLSTSAFCAVQSISLSETTLTFDKNTSKQQVNIANKGTGTLFWNAKPSASWIKVTPGVGKINNPAQIPANSEYLPFNFWPKPANVWQLTYPVCIGIDNEGSIYVLDSSQHRVVKFNKNEQYLLEINTGLDNPAHIAFDAANNAYVIDSYGIKKFDKFGQPLGVIPCTNYSSVIGHNHDIAIDSKDNLYVSGDSMIVKLDKNGKYIKNWGSSGLGNGQITPSSISAKGCRVGIVIDALDYVYVADNHYRRIQKFDAQGNFIKAWAVEKKLPTTAASDGTMGRIFCHR